MEDIEKLIKNLDKLANIVIERYKSYELIYQNLECIVEKGECSCKIPDDIKGRENIIEAVLNICGYITKNNGSCYLIISNYSEIPEITRKKVEFILDVDRVNTVKYYKPYRIYIENLKTTKGLIQISVYIRYNFY